MTARGRRRKIYHRASAIARAVRTADFPDAVNTIARLIAGPMTRKRPNLVEEIQRKIADALDLPPNLKVEFMTEPLQPSTDVVMVEGRIPVSAPLARDLVADGILTSGDASHGPSLSAEIVAKMARSLDKAYRTHLPLEQWKGPILEQPPAYDVFEPAGPDSFGGEDGMHSPAAATIRAELEARKRS